MKLRFLLPACLLGLHLTAGSAEHATSGIDREALAASLRSAIARTAYDEYVGPVIVAFETQADSLRAVPDESTDLTPDTIRSRLAAIESLSLTRERIGQSRRALLACTLLTREEAELLLGRLAGLKARCDRLITEEALPRKARLVQALEQAAAVPEPEFVPPPPPPAHTTADILAAAQRHLRPAGIAFIDSQYQLLLDGRRVKAGSTFPVRLDRVYTVTITAVTKNSYTLALAGESLVVKME